MAGTTVVCDRYAYSGVAFSASKPGECCCPLRSFFCPAVCCLYYSRTAHRGCQIVSDSVSCLHNGVRVTCGSLQVRE